MPNMLPTINSEPPQGIQALLDTTYLWNPDVANELIEKINELLAELGGNTGVIKPYSMLESPVKQYTPCYYGDGVYSAKVDIETVPEQFDSSQWVLIARKTFQSGTGIDIQDDTISVTYAISEGAAAGSTAVQPNELGTAAYAAATDFATAEQGGKADTAVQPDGLSSAIATHNTASDAHSNIITPITTDISGIQEKIPSQASSSNQLADKQFVNSSIATNTANFIGTFETVSALEAYPDTVTNNDYAFVVNSVVTDDGSDWATFADLDAYDKSLLTEFDYAWVINGNKFDLYRFDILNQEWVLRVEDTTKAAVTLNTAYNRYKATVASSVVTWAYEYTLNNSSFTASQWAAINSGATPTNIAQIGTNTSSIAAINLVLSGYGDIVTHNASEFATAAQGARADRAILPGNHAQEVEAVPQWDSMPQADTDSWPALVQYWGDTDTNFTHGYYYENVRTISSASATFTIGEVSGCVVSISDADFKAWLEAFKPANHADVANIARGTFGYYSATRLSITFYDANDHILFYTGADVTDLEAAGFSFSTPVVSEDNIAFTCTISAAYAWVQKDTQPQGDAFPSQTGNAGKFLTTDGTNVSWGNALKNTADDVTSLGIIGTVILGRKYQTVIGYGAGGGGYGSMMIGYNSRTTDQYVTAIGTQAEATGGQLALGYNAKAKGFGSIQIGAGTNNDACTVKIGTYKSSGNAYIGVNVEILDANNTVPADRLVHAINKYSTMPTAASANEGWIVQYTGVTDSTYTHGYIYECVSDGQNPATYSWVQTSVQPQGSSLPSQAGNSGKFLTTDGSSASWAAINALQNTATGTSSLTISGTATSYADAVNIGFGSTARQKSVIVGSGADANGDDCVAIGFGALASVKGVSIGRSTQTYAYATAVGYGAMARANYAVQLGYLGSNTDANTFKVANQNGNFEIMSANGTIPTDRFTTTPGTAGTYSATIVVDGQGNVSRSWATAADPLPSQTGQSGKFLTTDGTAASWSAPTVATFRVWGANE